MEDAPPPQIGGGRWLWRILAVIVLLFLLCGVALGPIGHGRGFYYKMERTQGAHLIAMVMFQYANDHGGDLHPYPEGRSSTEVFQKLLDGGYCSDPALFYIPMRGKTPPVPGQKLKPENVCWDVTSCVNEWDSDALPLVFMTGYKMTYAPDGSAVPLVRPYPPYIEPWPYWINFSGMHEHAPIPGLAVAEKRGSSAFRLLDYKVSADGSVQVPYIYNTDAVVSHAMSAKFDSKGKTWIQLTPDGRLP